MTERDALLRAVCENPDDDLPRLVLADWLEERDEPERAEFIRVQCELVRSPSGENSERLRQRERELHKANAERWAEPFLRFNLSTLANQHLNDLHYRRGFVYGVDISDADDIFADHAHELFRLAPIQRLAFFHKWSHEKLAGCPELLRLRELSIDRAGFEADELRFLFASPYLGNIVRLDLIGDDDNGHLDRDGLELLSQTMNLASLRYLDLSGNWCNWMFQDEGDWITSLITGPLVGQLECLRLRGTFLNDGAAELLAQCEQLSSLTHLDLAANMIGERGLQALAESPYLSRLSVLDLRENHCENEEGVEIGVCGPETRRLLEARFGSRVLLDGKAD